MHSDMRLSWPSEKPYCTTHDYYALCTRVFVTFLDTRFDGHNPTRKIEKYKRSV
jgi:hypothetical protein